MPGPSPCKLNQSTTNVSRGSGRGQKLQRLCVFWHCFSTQLMDPQHGNKGVTWKTQVDRHAQVILRFVIQALDNRALMQPSNRPSTQVLPTHTPSSAAARLGGHASTSAPHSTLLHRREWCSVTQMLRNQQQALQSTLNIPWESIR